MTARTPILVAVVALTLLLAYLTIDVLIRDGFSIIVLASLVIIAMFAFGAIGALTHSPDK
ncbi:MAG: hypothetical protein ACR2HC_03855 [Thermoleophilaceae bacterium]